MPYLTRATLVRAAVERAAVNARANAPIPYERDHNARGLTMIASARLALRTSFRELSERRHERARCRALTRKLATYTTPAEVQDLLGTIEGQEGDDAEKIRSILAGNLQRQRTHQLASFRPHSEVGTAPHSTSGFSSGRGRGA
jgi:hypothetical protein